MVETHERAASMPPKSGQAAVEPAPVSRAARNRARRSQRFLEVGLRIVSEEGLDSLTMTRLAQELDTAVGAVYRYYASKRDLIAAIQADAIAQLHRSHDASVGPVAEAVSAIATEPRELIDLVVLGRWFCAAAHRFPQQIRLLNLVSARSAATVNPSNAEELLPSTLALVGVVQATIDAASVQGSIDRDDSLARAILWLTAFGGVFVADDLAEFVPSVLGGGRLVRRLNRDLVVGWGAAPDAVARIDSAVDSLDGIPALAAEPAD